MCTYLNIKVISSQFKAHYTFLPDGETMVMDTLIIGAAWIFQSLNKHQTLLALPTLKLTDGLFLW